MTVDPGAVETALSYVERGWKVFPIRPGMKTPATKNGFKDATTDAEQVKAWWAEGLDYNVGIATGKESGFTVIDLDGPHTRDVLKAHGLKLPQTYKVRTPNGYHIYLAYEPAIKQTAGGLVAGDECSCERDGSPKKCAIDVRNDGGYVVAPPSKRDDGGEYKVFADEPLGTWPEIGPLLGRKRPTGSLKDDWQGEKPSWVSELLVNGAPDGQRNGAASRLAGYFRSINVPRDIAMASMKQFADACKPPMDYQEMQDVVESVWRYAPTKGFNYQGVELEPPLEDVTVGSRRVYRWVAEDLQVSVDRLRETARGIECEITVATSAGVLYGPVHTDLMSHSQRDRLKSALKDRKEFNWSSVMQHVAYLVRQSLRAVEQFVSLARHKRKRADPWLVEPMLRRGQPTLLYGHGGVGKSTIADAIAVSVARGESIIPGLYVRERANVAIFDVESDADDHSEIVEWLCNGAGIEVPEGLYYWSLKPPLIEHIDWLKERCAEFQIGLAVIDSVVGAGLPADPFSPDNPMSYKLTHQGLGITVLGISHVSADQIGKQEPRPYGSVYFWDWSRACWYASGTQEPDSPINNVGLKNLKANRGKQQSLLLETEFDVEAGTIVYRKGDKLASPLTDQVSSLADRIELLLIQMGAMLPREIAEDLGVKPNAIRSELSRNSGKRFVATAEGRWGAIARNTERNVAQRVAGERNTPRNTNSEKPSQQGGVTPPVAEKRKSEGEKQEDRNVLRFDDEDEDQPFWARG